jgi:ADP-ribosylglycohydrolase
LDAERLARARLALEGLSVGDALGGFFEFNDRSAAAFLPDRRLPSAPWYYTDDTSMALSIYETLRLHGFIHQDELAVSFASYYERARGYGPSIHRFVHAILNGQHWREASSNAFGGQGSWGNGGAMRVAPVGAYFADDLPQVVDQSHRSCEVTHAHPEGMAGAVAVAVASALAWQFHDHLTPPVDFLDAVLEHIPESDVRAGLRRARDLSAETTLESAAEALGAGQQVSAQDTVPLALWIAARHLKAYPDAIWSGIAAGGDTDTLCAIVGGIVALSVGQDGIPADWIACREPLPDWAIADDEPDEDYHA